MTAVAAPSARPTVQPPEKLQRTAQKNVRRKIAFIPNASFKRGDDQTDWTSVPCLKAVECGDTTPHVPRVDGLPAHLMRLCETPVMSVTEEQAFFRRINYLKYRANALQSQLAAEPASAELLDEFVELGDKIERIRNYIIQANIRLVMSIAKKFSNATNAFDDMLSEGISSLMDAVEKFDYDRGFRFSTYATTSIQRALNRNVAKSREQRIRFATSTEEVFAASPSADPAPLQHEVAAEKAYGSLTEMIEQLDPREKLIIRARFGFDSEGARKATYTSLSTELGISKERVRQLAERAISKLRSIAPEFGLMGVEA